MSNIDKSVYVATGAIITGDVTIAEDCSIWYNAVIRGDEYPITIGSRSNIQDNAVVHVGAGHSCIIGHNVTVGHGAIVHGCTVGDDTLIGMGAIILNGARIGKNCIIGAGALVSEGKEIPDGSVVLGVPGKIVRQVNEHDMESHSKNVALYVEEGRKNRQNPPVEYKKIGD